MATRTIAARLLDMDLLDAVCREELPIAQAREQDEQDP